MDVIYLTGCIQRDEQLKNKAQNRSFLILSYCFWYFPVRFPQYYHRKTKKTSLNKKLNECKVQLPGFYFSWYIIGQGVGWKIPLLRQLYISTSYTPEKGSAAVAVSVAVISLIIATDGCGQNESTTIWSFSSYIL
jgi:hypothetical protein